MIDCMQSVFLSKFRKECCKLGFKTRDGEILARQQRARKNRLRTLMHFLRISVSPATEKLIGQCAQSKVARAQWRYGTYVFASTRQRSVLFHEVPLNELENSSNTTKRLLTSCY